MERGPNGVVHTLRNGKSLVMVEGGRDEEGISWTDVYMCWDTCHDEFLVGPNGALRRPFGSETLRLVQSGRSDRKLSEIFRNSILG